MSARVRKSMSSIDYKPFLDLYRDQPKEVSLETLARCNAACTFCPYPSLTRIGEKMPDEMISKLIAEMATWEVPFTFAPFKVNEMFLDVRMQDICETFSKEAPSGTLRLFTNGSPLTRKNLEWVANLPRVEHLWISLNEWRAKEYQELMGIPFDRTAKNLDLLHDLVAERQFQHPVVLSKVGQDVDFQYYCRSRWPMFKLNIIKKDGWLGFTDPDDSTVPDSPCIRWFELSIMADGLVSTCCMHDGQDKTYNIGDLNKQTMLEVYNSDHWRKPRESLLNRRTLDSSYPCSRCSY
jgi:Radical SAM superfamily/Iron-sulfur cluster-binding domain